MKNFRHLCAVIMLTFLLALPAFAGQIETGVTSPPPTTTSATAGQTQTGATSTRTTSSQLAGAPSITETVLNLLQGVLALF
ncbi:MAG: hypothetical protein ACR2LC_12570 [Pyrinomonadaceae bacterium]